MGLLLKKPLLSFLLLTWLLSWPFWFVSGVLGRHGAGPLDIRWLIAQLGVFGPSVAALIVSGAAAPDSRQSSLRMASVFLLVLALAILVASAEPPGREALNVPTAILTVVLAGTVGVFVSHRNRRLRIPGTGRSVEPIHAGWYVLAAFTLPAVFVLSWLIVNNREHSWAVSTFHGDWIGFAATIVVLFASNLLLGGALGEEIGWRGFALPKLMERYDPFSASIILGVIQALWHAPIDLTSGFVLQGLGAIVIRTVWAIPVTIVFTWFYLRSKNSLLVAVLLHASVNTLGELGFSNEQKAITLLWLFLFMWSLALAGSEVMRRSGTPRTPTGTS